MKSHTFRGLRYVINICTLDGYCEVPGVAPRQLHIREDQTPRQFLESAIHEAMHAEDKDIPEKVIDRRAKSMTRWLWRLGYRRVDKGE